FKQLGCEVIEDHPNLSKAQQVFETIRAYEFNVSYSHLLNEHENELKSSLVWNIKEDQKLTVENLKNAELLHFELYHEMREFFSQYDAFILPVSQVSPFPVEFEHPDSIAGKKIDNYIDWVRSCSDISVFGYPSLSIPGGFTEDKLH